MKSALHRRPMCQHRRLHPLVLALAGLMPLYATAAPSGNALPNASMPLAGSVISNMALGEYIEEGSTVVQTSRSNLVETTIIPVYAFRLDADRSTEATAGKLIYFSHELRNTGNTTDSYLLTLNDPVGGIEYADEAVYFDRNRDGIPDGAALSSGQLAAIALQAGESVGLLIGATVPVGTAAATYNNSLTLSAKSNNDNTLLTLTNNDTVIVSGNAVINVRKSFSVAQAASGTVVTITLRYENTSNVASGIVTLTDDLSNGQLIYQPNSATWSGGTPVTDAVGGDAAGLAYNYNSTSKIVTAQLTSVPANSNGTVTFQVAINSPAGNVPNSAGVIYDPDNNPATANNVTTTSNQAVVAVPSSYGVVINAITGSASQLAADNLQTINSVPQGGVATFQNYVWNTGNLTDTFNLTFTGSTLPAGSVVEFFRTDGATPILDSNGDGIPDTGALAAGASYPIVVKVRFPTTQTDEPAKNYSIFPQAQSIASSAAVDTVEDRTNSIQSQLVDLANTLPVTGTGNGNIQNGDGSALKTLTVEAGGTVVYPITVKHLGTPTQYTLNADADTNFNVANLPAGVTVVFAETGTGGTCTPTGNTTGQTRLLNDGETQTLCAIVSVASGTAPVTATPLHFRAYSPTYVSNGSGTPTNAGLDIIKDALTITNASPAQVLFTPDLRGQIAVGGTIVYTHTIVNQGTTPLLVTQPFAISNDQAGFSTTLYYDANNNGVFDATDPLVTDLDSFSSNGANGLDAGESVRIFAKVANDGTPLNGVANNTVIRLLDGAGVEIERVQDVTTMSDTLIRLTKMQALDANCDGTSDNGSFTSATLPIQRNSVTGVGQCVLYRLTVKNEGAVGIGAFNFRDSTPSGTLLKFTPTCTSCTGGSIVSPAVGASGAVSGQVPSIAPAASYTFNFGVQYNGR